ncbi:unnamed protein product [Lactuca saligna]|uniref:CBP/p300-type HAT domain-containing protein n=1 Tax=Lactuca saligna TaxID=75948 RepID=A0AA35VJK9_LACSI|nr:unnamed protein product [Lactuca saligna]
MIKKGAEDGVAENIVKKLEVEETSAGGLQSKLPNKGILKAMGYDKPDVVVKDVLVMEKMGQTILHVKENFMIVHLQHVCNQCHEVILSRRKWGLDVECLTDTWIGKDRWDFIDLSAGPFSLGPTVHGDLLLNY